MRNKIIGLLVKRLRDFGYPAVNASNVLTDSVYSEFARRILLDTIEEDNGRTNITSECRKLIAEIEEKATEGKSDASV